MSGSQSEGEADLTPILDMVFQLITFFMLVMNFKAAALDLTLKLPVVGSAMPVNTDGKEELLILNLSPTGDLTVYGEKVELERYIAVEADVSRMAAKGKVRIAVPVYDLRPDELAILYSRFVER